MLNLKYSAPDLTSKVPKSGIFTWISFFKVIALDNLQADEIVQQRKVTFLTFVLLINFKSL